LHFRGGRGDRPVDGQYVHRQPRSRKADDIHADHQPVKTDWGLLAVVTIMLLGTLIVLVLLALIVTAVKT
jgi:hypothetical protein